MGATAAEVQFDWPPEAHFDACWLCCQLISLQGYIGAVLRMACQGKGTIT